MLAAIINYLQSTHLEYYKAIRIHILISTIAIVTSIIISVPLGIICSKNKKFSTVIMNLFNFLRIIPSLAILVLVMPILGTGFPPALLALTILAIPPTLINTYLGFKNVDKFILESARGMGMGPQRILFKIELPLALPLIITGIRTSAVEVIASAALASYIGAGGLGDFIFTGLSLNDSKMLLLGGISVALLSITSEILLALLQHNIIRYQRI
ncbi:ABC transporter permease [Clostridium sp. WILCCON 0269]|uniref:ABC transporter permease n=1 Tax=Candidatus Clostridium eludens TaxID=3381663 RepID=A0ABW8SIB2_9CLOT